MTAAKTTRKPKADNGAKAGEQKLPDFPVATLQDALPYLRQPFAPGAVGFKPQQKGEKATLCVAYIDARTVIERLNLVVGSNWTARYEKADDLGSRVMWCHLTVDGVTRSDVGEGTGKALISDSLKRAAVHFGIGRSLYASPAMWLKGKADRLSDEQRLELRRKYEKWLAEEGVRAFGPILHHGDTASGSVGVAIDPEGSEEPEQPDKVKTISAEQAAALRDRFDALPGEPKHNADELKLLLGGELGVSARSVNTALAKLTPTQATVVDGWLADAEKAGEKS